MAGLDNHSIDVHVDDVAAGVRVRVRGRVRAVARPRTVVVVVYIVVIIATSANHQNHPCLVARTDRGSPNGGAYATGVFAMVATSSALSALAPAPMTTRA